MAENEQLSDIEELHSPVKNEVAEREYTPPPRQKKHKIKRRPTHRATCPKNPSRRLIFSSQDEQDPSPARHCTKKKRKMKRRKSGRSKKQKFTGRDIEVSGTWVQCTNKDCMKWRYLSDITDPSHVPDVWTCEMNSDSSYNSCLLPEQDYSSLKFVHSKFTEGSLVWARMQGFPWWPAMIEEDPDSELCLYPDPVTGYVTDYHVIFLDKKVTRCWVKVSNIQKYEGGESPGSMMIKGRDYSKAIKAAKDVADEALKLPIKERIKTFGFSARFKGPWGEEKHRASDESQHSESRKKKGPKPQKRIIIDEEDSSLAGSLLSHSDMDDILDEAEALLGEVQNIVMEVEDEVQESLLQEMEKDENGSPSLKRKAEMAESDEPPMKQKKKIEDGGSSKQETSEDKAVKAPKEKLSSEMRMSKELERIQKKKEKEMHMLELRELKEREKIEKREKERQAKKDQKAKEKLEKEEKKKREKEEEKEKQEKEKRELKEKAKQEKKERKHKEKQAKKELKKKEKAEKKALEGEARPAAEGKEKEDDAEKAARKEKKRLEKEEKKKLKKEMKAKRKEEKKKEGNEGKATKPKGTEKVKPSFQKQKKPTFSAPKPKSVETPLAVPIQPTPEEESSVSKEIGALINEIVSDNNQTSEVAIEPMTSAVAPSVVSALVPANLPASPIKNTKKQFKPKFSIKTKDGASLSESNLPDKKTLSPPVLTAEDGLSALDEETSVDIAKILEVNANQDSQKSTEAEPVKENSDPLAFPLSEMTGKQLELLPKLDPQEDSNKAEEPRQESLHIKEPEIDNTVKMDDVVSESKKILKTLDQPEIEEFSPESTDWSESDEPQTVPGQKTVMVAPPEATCMGADSDDSEPFDMEE